MRWKSEAEKKLVLEAAAEYMQRQKALEQGDMAVRGNLEHFEEWLRWWFGEQLHTQEVSAYMKSTAVPKQYEQPEQAAVQPRRQLYETWQDLLNAAEKHLPDREFRAVEDALKAGNWKRRPGEKLHSVLSKITSARLQQAILSAWTEVRA